MSSPTESLSAPVNETNSSKRILQHIEIAGIRIPVPHWAVACIGLVAVVAASGGSAFKVLQPMIQRWAAGAEHTKVVINEYQKHFGETPRSIQELVDSPDLGMLAVQFYSSDGCLLVLRRNPGPNQPTIRNWIPKASIEADQPPGQLVGGVSMFQNQVDDHALLTAQLQPALFWLTKDSAAPVSGNCLSPHPGEFRSWNGEQKGCWLAVWRAWPDGCQHYQWFNTCNGYWDSEPTGAPRVYWTNCNH